MKVERIETIRVHYDGKVVCDIIPAIDDPNTHDFWLHHKDYGESAFMFGMHVESIDNAVEIAMANIPDYLDELVLNEDDDEDESDDD